MASALLGPRKQPTAAKLAPYECGIVPDREPPQRFPVRFYLVAMIFIIFDIEIVFLYPWAVVFRQLRAFGLVEVLVFAAVVFVRLPLPGQQRGAQLGPGQAPAQAGMPSRTSDSTIAGSPRSRHVPGPGRLGGRGPWASRISSTTSSPAGSRTWSSGRAATASGRPPSAWPAAPSR